jgi:hypothetical protein
MAMVDWRNCPCGVKRGFESKELAEKAMGRAQSRRNRRADAKYGTRRGLERENRTYECQFGVYHLTKQSRREHLSLLEQLQEQYADEIGVAA